MADDGYLDALLKQELKPFTITVDFPGDQKDPAANCTAQPCPVCLACSACHSFHGYSGRGCTEDNCPLLDVE